MKLRTIIMSIFSVLMVALIIWFFNKNWSSIREIRLVNPQLLWVFAALVFARMTLRGLFHWQVMRSLGVDIPVREALALNYAGTMMNQLLPMPVGPGYRAAYLKRNYNFPFSLFASTIAALFIYWLMVSASLGLGSAIWYYVTKSILDPWIFGILGLVVASCVAMFVIPKFVKLNSDSASFVGKRIGNVVAGWQTIVGSKNLILGASLVVIVSTVVSAAAMYVGFKIIGVDIELPGALLLMASQRIGSLIKLTPGAVGYQEMVGMYFATILDPTAAQAAVVFGFTRLINTALSTVSGLPAVWLLSASKSASGLEEKIAPKEASNNE